MGMRLTFFGEFCFALWRCVRFRRSEGCGRGLHGSAWIGPARLPKTRERRAPTPCSAWNAVLKTIDGPISSIGGLAALPSGQKVG